MIVYDNKTHNYILNQHAKTLLNINSDDALSSDVFNNITLRDFNDDTVITIEQLFTSTITAVLLECEFTPQLLNVNLSTIDDSVSMITLEENHSHAEQYNFDQIISKISTKLIDIQNDNIDQQINFALKVKDGITMKKRTQLGLVMTSVAMALGSASVNAAELEITVTNATKSIPGSLFGLMKFRFWKQDRAARQRVAT